MNLNIRGYLKTTDVQPLQGCMRWIVQCPTGCARGYSHSTPSGFYVHKYKRKIGIIIH
jgi:hypothetical protein